MPANLGQRIVCSIQMQLITSPERYSTLDTGLLKWALEAWSENYRFVSEMRVIQGIEEVMS